MPKKLAIIVCMAITIVTEARNFMTIFSLLGITEVKASTITARTTPQLRNQQTYTVLRD